MGAGSDGCAANREGTECEETYPQLNMNQAVLQRVPSSILSATPYLRTSARRSAAQKQACTISPRESLCARCASRGATKQAQK